MRGISLWRVTVNAGACAPAGWAAAAPPSTARRTSPGLTSEAVVESHREAQALAGGHRLRRVQAQPAPIDAQAEVRDPAAERRQAVAGQPARPAAHEPRLPGVSQHDEVRPLEREEGLGLLVLRA